MDLAYEKIDRGTKLAMRGELLDYAPSAPLLDPRNRREPIDANTARLIVPLGDARPRGTVRHPPGRPGAGSRRLTSAWGDRGKPCVVFDLGGVAYDADVSGKAFGEGG